MSEDCDEYYDRYKELKRKLRFLLFENQAYQDELRQSQKKLLQVGHFRTLDHFMNHKFLVVCTCFKT